MREPKQVYNLNELPVVLTLEQVGRLLQINVVTLRSHISKGLLPAWQFESGGNWRVNKNDLMEYIDTLKIKGSKKSA